MGCAMSVRLAVPPEVAAAPLRATVDLFAAFERVLSRFDPASELARLNRRTGEWVAVSPLLWSVVDAALAMAEETAGLFDPTLLAALEAAGYDRSFEHVAAHLGQPAGQVVPTARLAGHTCAVERRAGHEVRLPPGVRLDVGGIAKGYVAQQAVESLRHCGPCLVDAGGDLAAGAAPPGWPGWPVSVAAPSADPANGQPVQDQAMLLWLVNGSVATSGVDYRHWMRGGRRMHHVIDPRTGLPADTDLLTATVLDTSAVRAEAWATAALVLGAAAADIWWQRQGLAGALIRQDGRLQITPALRPAIAWPALDLLEPNTAKDRRV
jgi:thiamine biosynthesis lipoprotein